MLKLWNEYLQEAKDAILYGLRRTYGADNYAYESRQPWLADYVVRLRSTYCQDGCGDPIAEIGAKGRRPVITDLEWATLNKLLDQARKMLRQRLEEGR